jgi:hypothetical protein
LRYCTRKPAISLRSEARAITDIPASSHARTLGSN